MPTEPAKQSGEEILELSPFHVTAQQGWSATESISGTRLRTDLRDIPNLLETFTKEFLQDFGLNSIEDALIYSASAENFFDRADPTDGDSNYIAGNFGRVRGLGVGTNSSALFDSSVNTDSYNSDAATVASGPSAVLFGLGNPAGTFDVSPSRAQMRNFAGVRFQFDSEGSKRASFDLNQVLVPRVLALRFMGLGKNEETHKKPNWSKDQRFTATATLQPLKNTTLRFWIERSDGDVNRAARNLPIDSVSLWLKPPTGSPYAPQQGYNNSVTIPAAATLQNTSRIFTPAVAIPTFIFNGVQPSQPLMGWTQSVVVANPSRAYAYGVPDSQFDANISRTINDPAIFPFDINVGGYLKKTLMLGHTRRIFLEQKLAENLFLELAYNNEDTRQELIGSGGGGGESVIYIDPNLYLPANLPGETTRRPNPNFGRYYLQYTMGTQYQVRKNDDLRATLSYELNPERRFAGWARFLGRHRFLGLASTSERHFKSQGQLVPRILDNATIPGATLNAPGSATWATQAVRQVLARAYLDSSFTPPGLPEGWEDGLKYVDANGVTRTTTQGFSGLYGADGRRLSTANTNIVSKLLRGESRLLTWQGQFLPDRGRHPRVVLNYGYRHDKVRTSLLSTDSQARDPKTGLTPLLEGVVFDPLGPAEVGINRNAGVIVRPLRWLGLFYSQSSTFDVFSNRIDPFGKQYPGAAGDGKDFGVSLELWSNKVNLRLNRFVNTAGPSTQPTDRFNTIRTPLETIEKRVQLLDPSLPLLNGNTGGFANPTSPAVGQFGVPTYKESSGYEVSLNLAPLPGWNVRISGSKNDVIESQIGQDWVQWINLRLPVWQSVVAKNGELVNGQPATWATADANPQSATENRTLEQYYNEAIAADHLSFWAGADGRRVDGSRNMRANLVTNYRFATGRLKGFSVGGAVRWRSAPIIGHPIKVTTAGTKIFDIDHPYYGKRELPVDLSLGYRGRMSIFGNLRYNVQLNVRNALNEDDIIPFRAYSDGTPVSYATVEPRVFVLSCGFDF